MLLHVVAITMLILFAREKPPPEEPASSDIAVVFDHGGEPQTAAPPAQQRGPNQFAQTPPAASPPPPPSQNQMEVNLNLPELPEPTIQSAPAARPQPAPQARPAPPAPPQHYIVMNNMSYGSPTAPAPPATMPNAMNMSLPESDTQAVLAGDFSVKGDIGADYMSELHKWVQDHGYYPTAAAEQGQEGNAVVEFTVHRDGHVSGAQLLQSSGSNFIDQAWFQLFADNQLPPFPPGTKSDQITVDYTGEFSIIR